MSVLTQGTHIFFKDPAGSVGGSIVRVRKATALNPGDTASIPAGLAYSLEPAMAGEAGLYRVRATDDPAGATWKPQA